MKKLARRTFLKNSALAAGLFTLPSMAAARAGERGLYEISESLLRRWCKGLLDLSIKSGENEGGIMCPACGFIHGRIADAVYPFLLMAKKYGEGEYLDAAVKLHRWREKYMSMPDGSWRNDFANGWRGITVFGAISLAEALKYCGDILDKKDRDAMRARLLSATKFIDKFLTVHRSNVNYPITASLAMHLAGEVFGDKKMLERGRVFASNAIRYITDRDKLVFGEAQPNDLKTAKKCFAVDLGYNVEESLPALVQYAVEAGDSEVLEAACESYLKHIEFMLPDGAWDNSWGTRNAKWTYWGSRTSDGCQAALALVADKNPVFYRAALKNAELLERCTADNLLYGGVHYREFGIKPCIHHAFAHAKVMANVVQNARPAPSGASAARLPRESAYGLKVFQDIDTVLIASGGWRATATGYDAVYHYGKSGHPTGGALSVLWHEKAGAVFAAGMNEYDLVEKQNMQPNEGFDTMATVPRIEISQGGALFMNAADLKAEMSAGQDGAGFFARARSRLVDAKQKPAAGGSKCETEYLFDGESALLSFSCENPNARIVLPLVAAPSEKVSFESGSRAVVERPNCKIIISADKKLELVPTKNGRIFNCTPGFCAAPFVINSPSAKIKIEVV